ncbi:MAG: D-alanyl-D-alanine carboxypeptidase family protein [Oscillospiraceae bacterium]
MKKLLSLILGFIIIISVSLPVSAAGFTPPFEITAASAYMVNLDTGLVLYEKNADEKRSIASLTKLMTTLLLIEKVPISELDSTVITANGDLYVPPVTTPGSSTADIRPWEEVTARTLLYAMMLPSGNEAAAVTAYYVGSGNMENFYAMMNARAKELGCKNTNFTNAHGLEGMDKGNYSTAHDLFLITQECWKHEIFRTIASSSSYEMPFTNKHTAPEAGGKANCAYTIYTTNYMQKNRTSSMYREYIKGVKTGSTPEAGRGFVSTASQDGMNYITVVLGTPYDVPPDEYAYSFYDTAALDEWAFKNFSVRPALDPLSPLNEVKLLYCRTSDALQLYPTQDIKTILPKDADATVLQKTYDLPEYVEAPVKQGDVIGKVTLSLAGEVIGKSDLIAGQDVERDTLLFVIAKIKAFVKSLYFRVVLTVTAITLIAYATIAVISNNKKRKAKQIKR